MAEARAAIAIVAESTMAPMRRDNGEVVTIVAKVAARPGTGTVYPRPMATIVLVRHGKADRPPGVPDQDRDLTDRGRRDSDLVGAFLSVALPRPGTILSSPAQRARATAERVAAAAGWGTPITIDPRLYGGSVADLLDALAAAPGDPVVAFGHEPVWSAAITTIMGGGAVSMVTAAAVCLEGAAEPGGGWMRWMVVPAALGGGAV